LTDAPLICIGGVDAKVKIYNAATGELVEVGATTNFTLGKSHDHTDTTS
jgi:hypothetical protein